MAIKRSRSRATPRTSRAKQIDFMKAVDNIGKPIAAVAGFAVGKFALKKLQKNSTSGASSELKDYIVPAAVAMGGLVGTQFSKNPYVQIGLVGAAGAGVEAMIQKATGKTLLQGLEGIVGDVEDIDYEEIPMASLPASVTQSLPAADIDIEREIQRASVAGTAEDFSMSDDPIGTTIEDYSMSDDIMEGLPQGVAPDSTDYDVFAGDMLED